MSKFIEKHDGQILFHFGENTFAYIENDWRQLFRSGFNWKTYRVADIYYENDVMLGGKEFRFVVLGLGFCIRHNNPNNEKFKEIVDMVESANPTHTTKEGE